MLVLFRINNQIYFFKLNMNSSHTSLDDIIRMMDDNHLIQVLTIYF